jgi:hypothetical protein
MLFDGFGRGDHGVGAVHQPPLEARVQRPLLLVDVDFGADHDRHAGHHRGEAPIETAGEEKGVHDRRRPRLQRVAQPQHVERPRQARRQSQHGKRHAGAANLFADRPGLVNAGDRGLESRRQVPHEIQHHFFGAANHECMREIQHPRPTFARAAVGKRHQTTPARR